MQVAAAFLCDSATVREGLLHSLGGGINRLWRDDFPAPVNAALALMFELHRQETDRPHELDVQVMGEDGEMVAAVKGGFQAPRHQMLELHEPQMVALVLPLHQVGLPKVGRYQIDIRVDSQHLRSITFAVRPVSEMQAFQQPPPSG